MKDTEPATNTTAVVATADEQPEGTNATYEATAPRRRRVAPEDLRARIDEASELWRTRIEVASASAIEKLGLDDKSAESFNDALEDMIPAAKLQDMIEKNIIQIAPLAFMRGRTLNDAVVILDEAQNTTSAQIKMFITRMGFNTKMIITGDLTQIDLPRGVTCGLKEAIRILKDIKGISFIHLNEKDIVRHHVVTQIVNAYKKYESENNLIQ